MSILLKEYGLYIIALIGVITGFSILSLLIVNFKDVSRSVIANITNVEYSKTEYINHIEE